MKLNTLKISPLTTTELKTVKGGTLSEVTSAIVEGAGWFFGGIADCLQICAYGLTHDPENPWDN